MAALKLSFKCEKCGHPFVLGENAWVVTSSGVMGMFPSGSRGGGGLEGNKDDPDLVDEFHGNYETIDSSKRDRQQYEIQRVRQHLAKGKDR